MSTLQDEPTPNTSVPQDDPSSSELAARKAEPNPSAPEDTAPPTTSVPQDNK